MSLKVLQVLLHTTVFSGSLWLQVQVPSCKGEFKTRFHKGLVQGICHGTVKNLGDLLIFALDWVGICFGVARLAGICHNCSAKGNDASRFDWESQNGTWAMSNQRRRRHFLSNTISRIRGYKIWSFQLSQKSSWFYSSYHRWIKILNRPLAWESFILRA